MKKWEYIEVTLAGSKENRQQVLNSFGRDGWELVCVSEANGGYPAAYLKRERS